MPNPLTTLALAAGVILPGCLPARANTADYNGRWAVELVTESGPCSASYTYAVAISGGHVRLVSGDDGARVSGQVGADGDVDLNVVKGGASGSGNGRLKSGGNGSGRWTVSSLCSGRWTARRSRRHAALAD